MKRTACNFLFLLLLVTFLLYITITEDYINFAETNLKDTQQQVKVIRSELHETKEDLLIAEDKLKQIEMRNEGLHYQEEIE